ncbi:MAG: ABC transporter ATP-binding protein/permease [Bacillaceae bacterium]
MIQKEMMVYAKRYRIEKILALVTILQIGNLIANIIIAFNIASMISNMFTNEVVMINGKLVVGMILLLILKGLCNYYSTKLTHYTSHELKYRLRKDLLSKLLSLSPQEITNLQISKISQLSVEGIENIDVYYSRYLPQLFYSLLAPILLFIILANIHFKIALFLLISMCFIPILIIAGVKIGKKIFFSYWNKYLNVGKKFVEGVEGLKTLKMYNGDETFHKIMNEESEEFRIMTMKVLRMQLQSITLMDLVSYVGTALGIVFSLIAYRNGSISLFGFICFALLSIEFFVPMRLLGSYFHVGLNGMSALNRLSSILNIEKRDTTAQNDQPINGTILFNDVSYQYPGNETSFILQPFSMRIKKGEYIAIVGPSGSGKTTFSQLLQGFIHPNKGSILIGDHDLRTISPEAIHSYMGSVSNYSHIFEGTIFSNLQLGCKTLQEDKAREVLDFVKLHEFSSNLLAPVKSEGANLSSGQRQKLAIARMLLKNPEVLIFDEATANIDQQSERDIFELIESLHKNGKTVIVITHYLNNIIQSNRILVFENGLLREEGCHKELLEQAGTYATLYKEHQSLEENII